MVKFAPNGGSNHAKCQSGDSCTGPGCRVKTGKTERKRKR